MTTERQVEYLRDLGIDPRVDLDGIAKVDASDGFDKVLEWVSVLAMAHGPCGNLQPTVRGGEPLTIDRGSLRRRR